MSNDRRIFNDGCVYHVLIRGHNRSCIFEKPFDKLFFLRTLKAVAKREKISVLYYVIMDNHYHMVLRQDNGCISRFMQIFNQAYARYYNKRYHRSGTVYDRRFSSFFVKDLRYLKNLILYIAYNPVKAGIVELVSQYKWCAHLEIASKTRRNVVSKEVLFEILGGDVIYGSAIYRQLFNESSLWLEKGVMAEDAKSSLNIFNELRLVDQFHADLRYWASDANALHKVLEGCGKSEIISLRKELLIRGAAAGYPAEIIAQVLGLSVRRVNQVIYSSPNSSES